MRSISSGLHKHCCQMSHFELSKHRQCANPFGSVFSSHAVKHSLRFIVLTCDRTDFLRSSRSRFHLGTERRRFATNILPAPKYANGTAIVLSIHNLITANGICDAVRLRTVSRSLQEVLQFRESDQQIQEFWFDLSLSL